VRADAERRGELPVEMEPGKCRDAAQHLGTEVAVEVRLDVDEHPTQPGPMPPAGPLAHLDLRPTARRDS